MDITTREQAIVSRQATYFTGVACKRGHICERYTKNGGCKHCMNPHFVSVQSEIKRAKVNARSQMIIRKFRIKPADLGEFQNILVTTCQLREASLQLSELLTARRITYGPNGTQIRSYWIFGEDEPMLRAVERAFELQAPPAPITPPLIEPPAEEWPSGDPR